MSGTNERAWSFPEPEKKTSWDIEGEKSPPRMVMRDVEMERAIRRTELIKERMSPPGALGLPPLLDAQRLKYGITDGAFRSQASFDRIYVHPLDLFEGEDTFTGTSIQKPNLTKLKDMQEGHRGVLISAGLIALDRLMSHGIELGHIVSTNKNVPFARRVERLETFEMFILVMRDGDLAGSETLAEELRAGIKTITNVAAPDGYRHQIGRVDKLDVQIEDNW